MFVPVKTHNAYHYFDYKQQLNPNRNDLRTNYDRGHRYQIVNDLIGPPSVSIADECSYTGTQPAHHLRPASETKSAFCHKAQAAPSTAERPRSLGRVSYVQRQEERIFRQPPRKLAAGKSAYQRDYTVELSGRPCFDALQVPHSMPYRPPPASRQSVQPQLPGHYKYLDPYASTMVLDYPMHTFDQQNGIARKDYITLWDWFGVPKGKGYGLHLQPLTQLHGPVRNLMEIRPIAKPPAPQQLLPLGMKPVPHRGNCTEMRSEYREKVVQL